MTAFEMTGRFHPLISLLFLLGMVLLGSVIFTALGFGIGILVYGMGALGEYREVFNGGTIDGMGFVKIVQISSTVGMFILPALILAKIENGNIAAYFHAGKKVPWVVIVASIALMFSSGPLVEWTFALNKQMVLPDFLQGLQEWMQNQEEQLNRITKQLLVMNNAADLLVNLIMIAALPAIGEELIFRGCFQNIFSRWTGSYHWGIWLAAILFSTIHVQFYGFMPRMLLGALFGYLFYWGRSIWLPILAHFVNNAAAVLTAYVYQRRGQSLDKLDETEPGNWAIYLMSIATTAALLWFIHSKRSKGDDKTTAE